mgnify:CR=1 FL=1
MKKIIVVLKRWLKEYQNFRLRLEGHEVDWLEGSPPMSDKASPEEKADDV